jgi:phage baseplate assembly protein W
MGLSANNGLTFPQRINGKGFMEFTDDIQKLVRCSILQILGTWIGERAIEVEFGSRLRELLFEPIDDILLALARVYTIQAIERWEPRVKLNDVGVKINVEQGKVDIYGSYVIVNKNIEDTFEVSIPRLSKGGT